MKCKKCNQEVMPVAPKFCFMSFIMLGIFTGGIGSLLYIVFWVTRPKISCPSCRTNNMFEETKAKVDYTNAKVDFKNCWGIK